MRCEQAPPEPPPPQDGIVFDAASGDDAEAIRALYHECGFEPRSAERMAELLADGRHAHGVGRQGDRIAAFVELETHWPRRPWVAYVGVDRGLRSRGTGTAIVCWALRQQFERGAEAGLLMLSPANRAGLRAYEKGGFRRHRLVDVLAKALG
jgi:ribosomal protein S18 acetylase RimI-like enzyme